MSEAPREVEAAVAVEATIAVEVKNPKKPDNSSLPSLYDNGFLKTFTDYSQQISDSDPLDQHITGLTVLSVAVGRVPCKLMVGDMFANVQTFIVGISGLTRKSSQTRIAKEVLPIECKLLPSEYTKEALYENLSVDGEQFGVWDECASVLEGINNSRSYLSGLDNTMCIIYDCPAKFSKETIARGKEEATDIYVPLLWATTLSKFQTCVKPENISSGFLSRFVILYHDKKLTPYKDMRARTADDDAKLSLARERLKDVYEIFHQSERSFHFELSAKAFAIVNDWQREREAEVAKIIEPRGADIHGAMYTRLGDYMRKFAILYEVDKLLALKSFSKISSPYKIEITEESMLKARTTILLLLNLLTTKLLNLLNPARFSELLVKLCRVFENSGEDILERSYVLPRMNIASHELDLILRHAVEIKMVKIVQFANPQKIQLLKKYDEIVNPSVNL